MRILTLTLRFHPAVGGAERNSWEVSRRLARRGHEITVITSDLLVQKPASHTGEGTYVDSGLRIIRSGAAGPTFMLGGALTTIPAQSSTVLKSTKSFDIVHAHGYGFYPAYGALPLARIRGLPSVLTAHTSPSRGLVRAIYDLTVGKLVAQSVDSIICVTNNEAEYFERLGVRPAALNIIPNGVDIESYKAPGLELEFRRMFDVQDDYVLFAGRLSRNKGVDVLLQAIGPRLKVDPNLSLIVAGGNHGHYDELRALTYRLGIHEKVKFTGQLSDSLLRGAFIGCKMFVLPSRGGEAQGITILEAMAAGKPVVATRVGGVPYTVIEGRNGFLVPPEDPVSMRASINRLLDDSTLSQRIGVENHNEARKYSWDEIADRTESVYKLTVGLT